MSGSSVKLIWLPISSHYSSVVKVTSPVVIHWSYPCPQKKKKIIFRIFWCPWIDLFMVGGAIIDVLRSVRKKENTHTHIHSERERDKKAERCLIYFSCQENRCFLLQRTCRSYDSHPLHPPCDTPPSLRTTAGFVGVLNEQDLVM